MVRSKIVLPTSARQSLLSKQFPKDNDLDSHILKITLVSAVLALAACGEPAPITNETRSMIVSFHGGFDGKCRVEAPNSDVKTSRFLGSDAATVRGGIDSSVIVCKTPDGEVQTTSHRNHFRPNAYRVSFSGVVAQQAGVTEVSGLSYENGGEFTFRPSLTWTRR